LNGFHALPVEQPVKKPVLARSFWWMILIAAQLGAVIPVLADESAVIPYKEIDRLWQFVSAVNPTNLIARVSVTSTNPAVAPSDVKMVIQSPANGMIMVEMSPSGDIRRFPHSEELARENPPIVANQPKGTLRLTLTWKLPLADYNSFRYSRLQAGVSEVNKAIKVQAGLMSAAAPQASGVIFIFPPESAGKAKVEIVSAAGRKEYVADAKGHVRIEVENSPSLATADVVLSEKAKLIVPDVN